MKVPALALWLAAPCLSGAALAEGGGSGPAYSEKRPAAEEETSKTSAELEMEVMRQRMSELEAQNAAILAELSRLRAQLDSAARRPAQASAPRRVAASSASVPSSAESAATTPAPEKAAQDGAPANVLTEGGGSLVSFYGMARFDAIFDDSRPDAAQTPTFIRSEGPASEGISNFTMHPRLTRLGFNYAGSEIEALGDARIGGKIEFDFQNGGRESRATPRYRHAYLTLDWQDRGRLLIGQTWDLISPLYPAVNADTLMWNAGNLGDRRAQVRYDYTHESGMQFAAGIGLTGAVSPSDLDGDGVRDGEASTVPNVQGRLGYTSERVKLGFWSHYGRDESTFVQFNGRDDFDVYSLGIDYQFGLHDRATLRGELWAGSNLRDFRGGIGQGVNTLTGRGIDSRGGWAELGFQVRRPYKMSLGYSMDDPRNQHVLPGGRRENRAWYIVNQFRFSPFTLGLDYLHWRTKFKGMPEGTDNRVNLYIVYGF